MRGRCLEFFCGRDARGALAGNGDEMASVKQELKGRKPSVKKDVKKEVRPSRKPSSRKGGKATKRAKVKAKPKEAEEQKSGDERTDGKEVLQRAAHRAAAEKSRQIAEKLAAKAALGDAASTRMLVLLMDGKLPPPRRKPGELTYAQQLAMDPPWEGEQFSGQ